MAAAVLTAPSCTAPSRSPWMSRARKIENGGLL
jgi:hypothetical protein